MLRDVLIEIYDRDLENLKNELNQYPDEAGLWLLRAGITNSAGNLCLHLIGNLNYYFGSVLGESGYIRDRDAEFSAKGVAREDLIKAIDDTKRVVRKTLEEISEAEFSDDYPLEFQDRVVKTDFMLVHLAAHFSYHLGQINYHRRLIAE